ncbi:MAG: energy transducer TonB [Bryobacteraceae bacterium]
MHFSSRVLLFLMASASLFAQTAPLLPLVDGAAAMKLVVKQVPAAYPPNLVDSNLQGIVHVVVEIGADGKLQNARAASGPVKLRQAGLDNIKQWTFRAYVQGGKPTAARANFDVVFKRI